MRFFRRHKREVDNESHAGDQSVATMPASLPSSRRHKPPLKRYADRNDGILWYKKSGRTGGNNINSTSTSDANRNESHPYDLDHGRFLETQGTVVNPQHSILQPQQQEHQTFAPQTGRNQAHFPKGEQQQYAGSLASLLLKKDWSGVSERVDTQPSIAQQKETLFLQGQKTTICTLHLAACVHPPLSLFNKILSAYPAGAQQPDESFGRLPIHWACLSNASVDVIERIVQAFPNGCKARDTAYSRTPLHYLCVYATSVEQIAVLLRAPINHKRVLQHKDKLGKTPMDLAKSTSNPIKLEIVNALANHQSFSDSSSQRTSSPKQKRKGEKKSEEGGQKVSTRQKRSDEKYRSVQPVMNGYSPNGNHTEQQGRDIPGAPAVTPPNQELKKSPPGSPFSTNSPQPRPQRKRHAATRASRFGYHEEDPGGSIAPSPRGSNPSKDERYPTVNSPDMSGLPNKRANASQDKSASEVIQPRAAAMPQPDSMEVNGEDDYYAKYMEKISSMSNDTNAARKDSNATGFAWQQQNQGNMYDPRSMMEQEKEASLNAQSLMDSMRSNIHRLEDSVRKLRQDLQDKCVDMENLESVTNELNLREQDLKRGAENTKAVMRHQSEELDIKKQRISRIKEKIAALEAELIEEESTLEPMERSILVLEQKIIDKEQKLLDHRQERETFEVMKQNLLEEKECLRRDLENSRSELKSLRAIQNLARGDDDL